MIETDHTSASVHLPNILFKSLYFFLAEEAFLTALRTCECEETDTGNVDRMECIVHVKSRQTESVFYDIGMRDILFSYSLYFCRFLLLSGEI